MADERHDRSCPPATTHHGDGDRLWNRRLPAGRLAIGVLLALVLPVTAQATIVRVPADHAQIGAGLAAAGNGDTVLVAPGTYIENIEWPATHGIKLLSEAGAEATIIDGGAKDSVIGIYTGVDTTTVVRGFTLQNGFAAGA